MKLVAPAVAACALAAHAHAQSLSGHWNIEARCGGVNTSGDYAMGDHQEVTRHGDCPSPRTGGLASSNDAALVWTVDDGSFFLSAHSRTDFFGTHDDAGSAAASHEFFFTASDIVITDLADPGRRGIVDISMNYLAGGAIAHQGASNCTPFQPQARAFFEFTVGPCRGQGSRTFEPDLGELADGVLVGAPTDGSASFFTTPAGQAGLVDPQLFFFHGVAATSVLYCDSPPAALGDAASLLRFSLPCGTPVFNLPPGFTCNSAQLGIVNNLWVGPAGPGSCCPADFNGDGFLDFFDYDDYVNCFETGVCPAGRTADFNGDNFADFFDYDAFVTAFELGC